MLQLPAVFAVVANTCQRPSTLTMVGSFTETIGWVASGLAVMSDGDDVHLNDDGNPESTAGALAPVPPAPVVVIPRSGSLAHELTAAPIVATPSTTTRRPDRVLRMDMFSSNGVSAYSSDSTFEHDGDELSFPLLGFSI